MFKVYDRDCSCTRFAAVPACSCSQLQLCPVAARGAPIMKRIRAHYQKHMCVFLVLRLNIYGDSRSYRFSMLSELIAYCGWW